ncbi:hypothetical protein [Symmachiella dynata]|uniref:hypothetical protein n=1 Tax=Symmachiella dynata TaxID=2527995 RepID=UPI0030EC6E69
MIPVAGVRGLYSTVAGMTAAILLTAVSIQPVVAEQVDAPASGALTHEKILKVWEEREQRVKSARFEWTEIRLITDDLLMPGESRVEPDVPQYSVKSSLSLKENQIRHTFRKEIWQVDAPRGENSFVSVSNGETAKVYLPPGYVTEYPRGHASQQVGSDEVNSTYLKPFLWCYRPSMSSVLVAPLEKFDITQERAAYQDRDCVVLRYQPTPTTKFELWLDPSRDFVIVRQQFIRDGLVANQLDVEYLPVDETRVWLPQEWRFAMLDKKGKSLLSMNGTLTRAEINPTLPDADFEFEFPPGTWVHEDKAHEHIVMADGKQRAVALGERGLPYESLLSGTGRVSKSRWKRVLVQINLSVVVFVCVGLVLRWNQMRSHR